MSDELQPGGFYSRNYHRARTLASDNERMRFRIAKFLEEYFDQDEVFRVGRYIERELGFPILQKGTSCYYIKWQESLANCSITDFLDIITAICRFAPSRTVNRGRMNVKLDLLAFSERVFREQSVSYRVDDKGGVHPFVDVAFTAEISELIRGFSRSDLAAAKRHIEMAEMALLADRYSGRAAIRSIFDAIENLLKRIAPGCTQLNKDSIKKRLIPEILASSTADDHEKLAIRKIGESLIDWSEAGHFYRHEPGKPEPTEPTQDFAIHFVSQGLSYARWLGQVLIGKSAKQ